MYTENYLGIQNGNPGSAPGGTLTLKYLVGVALAVVSTSFAGVISVASVTASSTFPTYNVTI
jgi:hypothetical protein